MLTTGSHSAQMMTMVVMEMPKPGHSGALCRDGERKETGRLL